MFDVYVIDNAALMVSRPNGVFDAQMIAEIVGFIEINEEH
jgi:hypothetical protein